MTRKPPERRQRVLLIDAVNEVARERSYSFLRPEHQLRISSAYAAFADEEGFARVTSTEEIGAQGWSLSIPLYVKRSSVGGGLKDIDDASLADAWVAWEMSGRDFWTDMDAVVDMLDGLVAEETVEVCDV